MHRLTASINIKELKKMQCVFVHLQRTKRTMTNTEKLWKKRRQASSYGDFEMAQQCVYWRFCVVQRLISTFTMFNDAEGRLVTFGK